MRTARRLLACAALVAAASAAHAADFPIPKVMSDAPPDRGKWRIQMLQADGLDAPAMQKQVAGDLSVCMTAAEAVQRRDAGAGKQSCDARLAEDTPMRAVVEVTCPGTPPARSRSTITRTGDRAYLVETEGQRDGRPVRMQMKMTYAGTCAAGDSVVSLGKDSAVCRETRAKVAAARAAKQCDTAADRAQCERTLAQAEARIEALCR